MSLLVTLTLLVAIPLTFSSLDVADWYFSRQRSDKERPRMGTLWFLLGVLLVYAGIQYGSFALVPQPEMLVRHCREAFGRWLRRPLDNGPMDGRWFVILVVVLFYVSGLWDYLVHRFVSHSRRLWFTHEYHHLPSQVFVLAPGVAARPFALVSTFPVAVATVLSAYLLLVLAGLPLWDLAPLQVLVVLQLLVLTSSHSSCLRRWRWVHEALRYLAITTPHEHVLHHTCDLRGNYGNFTTLWDRLFGTYLDPTRPENQGHALGLAYDQDFLGTLTLGKIKLSDRLRRRFQVGRYCNLRPGPEESV
jgi:sterol desaturase/sphingolipid hydroxylase (fatty acid hydroxylase superfamily)